MTYLILSEEYVNGVVVYRRLAVTDDDRLADQLFRALSEAGGFDAIHLVKVLATTRG